MKRAAALLALGVALLATAPALGYWRASGVGSGTAPVDVLAAGNQPTTTVAARTVTVSWTQTVFHSSLLGTFAGGSYAVRRYPAAGGAAVTPSAPCSTTVTGTGATLTCAEPTVPFGTWKYSVSPRLGVNWTGDESPLSATTSVRPDTPVPTPTSGPAGRIDVTWPAVTGATSYAISRRTGNGALTPLTPVTATSYADTATTSGTTYGYVITAVAPAASGGTINSIASTEVTALADAAGPAVALTNPGTPLRATVALAATASDGGTGVSTVKMQRAPAGTTTWTDVCTATTSPYSCSFVTTAVADGLYDLRAIATDSAGNATTAATVTSRRIDNTAPAASLTSPAAYLRATVSLAYTTSDGGSGLASVKVQRAPTGTTTWTDVCSTAAAASPCSFNTTLAADGVYDLRLLSTDAAGNTGTSVVAGRTVDNTKPLGTNVQTTNAAGGTAGRPEQGDVITFTFSEAMAAGTILTGWTGAATTVAVSISSATPGVLTVTGVNLGSVSLGQRYATNALTFATSSMTMTGSTVSITLGTGVGMARTGTGTSALSWTTVATPTDLAGNALTVGTVTEGGTADLDF